MHRPSHQNYEIDINKHHHDCNTYADSSEKTNKLFLSLSFSNKKTLLFRRKVGFNGSLTIACYFFTSYQEGAKREGLIKIRFSTENLPFLISSWSDKGHRWSQAEPSCAENYSAWAMPRASLCYALSQLGLNSSLINHTA